MNVEHLVKKFSVYDFTAFKSVIKRKLECAQVSNRCNYHASIFHCNIYVYMEIASIVLVKRVKHRLQVVVRIANINLSNA